MNADQGLASGVGSHPGTALVGPLCLSNLMGAGSTMSVGIGWEQRSAPTVRAQPIRTSSGRLLGVLLRLGEQFAGAAGEQVIGQGHPEALGLRAQAADLTA